MYPQVFADYLCVPPLPRPNLNLECARAGSSRDVLSTAMYVQAFADCLCVPLPWPVSPVSACVC